MDKEQIIALAEKADETATQYLQCAGEYHPDYHSVRDEHFYHAAISAYKAELLKEAGEPEYFRWDGWDSGWVNTSKEEYDSIKSDDDKWMLYPSDQVAAAVAKATKPLEEEIERLFKSGEKLLEEKHKAHKSEREVWDQLNELRTQLAKAEQLWQVAQGRCDALEEKLAKAEQRVAEWQPIETAPKDGSWFLGWRQYSTRPRLIQFDSDYDEFIDEDGNHVYSVAHWMPLPKAPNGASS